MGCLQSLLIQCPAINEMKVVLNDECGFLSVVKPLTFSGRRGACPERRKQMIGKKLLSVGYFYDVSGYLMTNLYTKYF